MDKKCTACGAPISGKKCEYCGEHIRKEKEGHCTEIPGTSPLNDIPMVEHKQYDSSTISSNHSGLSMLPKKKNILLLIIYCLGMTILPIIVMVAVMLISGLDPATMAREEHLNVTTIAIVASYGILTSALLLLTRDVFKKDFMKIDSWGNFAKQMALGTLSTFAAAIVGGILVQLLGVNETAVNQEAVEASLNAMPLAMIFSVVIFAPIVEEIIFRLVLMKLFNWKPVYSILFSSFLFGLMHVIAGGELIHVIPYFLIGIVFGFIYHKNDNIWHATILHMLHNGLSAVLLFVGQGLLAY
jgi:membrane protease YdiL (CAAX protease family)